MPRNMQNAETACGGHRLIGARSRLKRFWRRRTDRPAIIILPGEGGKSGTHGIIAGAHMRVIVISKDHPIMATPSEQWR